MQICDADSTLKIRSNEYKQHLITRCYKLHKVRKQFFDDAKISRETAQQLSVKMDFKVFSFLT